MSSCPVPLLSYYAILTINSTHRLLNWAIAFATPHMVNPGPGNANLGSKVFFIWGTFCLICVAFVYFMIYETKGLSLEQVDELYEKVGKAWQSKGFVPTVNFTEVHQVMRDPHGRSKSLADIESEVGRKRSVAHVEDGLGAGVGHEKY